MATPSVKVVSRMRSSVCSVTLRRREVKPQWPQAHCSTRSCSSSSSSKNSSRIPTQQSVRRRPAVSHTPIHRASYHSYDHPGPASPFSKEEETLLSAGYAHIPEHGFTPQALVLGARDAGYIDISTNLLPEGVFSLVRYHLVTQRLALASRGRELLAADDAVFSTTREKVQRLVRERLLSNAPVIGRWQEALAIMAQPSFVSASVKELALLADEILFLAGDVSVDPSWYTKRASLCTIYASSELFMTTDRSPGFEDTAEFVRRRFAEAGDVTSVLGSVSQWVGFTASAGLNLLRSKGARI